MLYVFQVDTGTMLTFDMNLALESVSNLKEAIWVQYRIPLDRQVLLVSGGECLEPNNRVHSYAAGTDTNPIYLFNKLHIETSPTSSGQSGTMVNQFNQQLTYGSSENLSDFDTIKEQVEANLPPTYLTVVTRSQLAQQLHDMAKDLTRQCENIIRDQHLQHQGWAAVVANLEDIITSFRQRIETFEQIFLNHMSTKEERMRILDGFEDDLKILNQIQLIPSLIPPEIDTGNNVSLLQWVEAQDPSSNLNQFVTNCKTGLESLDPLIIENLQREARSVVEKAGQNRMIEIKGLEERLIGLDQLLSQAKKKVQEQYELAQGFLQNQNRASELKDSSILSDLCESHKHQLVVMQGNHQSLEDIFRRCSKAKEELSTNLNQRLRWVMMVQKSMVDTSNKLTMYQERLKRVRCQVEVVEQIHSASELYCKSVVEVVRRKKFSDAFLHWANRVAERMNRIHREEVNNRREFGAKFESHFLSALFPGMNDLPPEFATQRPALFDAQLPFIQLENIEDLKTLFPSVSYEDDTPDFTADIRASSRSDESSKSAVEMENVNLKLELEGLRLEMQNREETLHRMQTENREQVEKLQFVLTQAQNELQAEQQIKSELLKEKETELLSIQEKLASVESILKTMEQEINQLKEITASKEQEWELQRGELIKEHEERLDELRLKLTEEKELEVNSVKEKAKGDLEALRSRYRLMSSFEQQRSPSDSNPDRSLDSFEKFSKPEDLTSELYRVIEAIQKSPPESMSPQVVRKIILKLEGQCISPRTRNISDTGLRTSFEGIDDPEVLATSSGVRSVYGLDTSAIDAASAMESSSTAGSGTPDELSEQLIPSQRVVNVASRLLQLDRITIQGCKAGDSVFVFWNDKLQTYMVYTNTKNVHFLHTDCLKLLNHSPEAPPTEGFTAQVVDKEFCVARRSGNRYRVPQGFHFYRVKVKVIEILDLGSFLSP